MQCHPAFARLNENLEQINTKIQQLRQCDQANQQCTQQKEINEAVNVQMAQRLSQLIRGCQQELAAIAALVPQVTFSSHAIRMQANLERLQATCRHLEQQQASNHQTTQQKQQHEASCAQLAQRIEQTVQSCQQDISQFVPAQQQPMTTQPWAQMQPLYFQVQQQQPQQQQQFGSPR